LIAKIWNKSYWVSETNPFILKNQYSEMLIESGFNILDLVDHNFKPYGYTALFLLAESHLAIHTFPEENKTYIEISSCIKNKFENFLKINKRSILNDSFKK